LKESILSRELDHGDYGFGEVLPYEKIQNDSRLYKLDTGFPTVTFDAESKKNEWKIREDI